MLPPRLMGEETTQLVKKVPFIWKYDKNSPKVPVYFLYQLWCCALNITLYSTGHMHHNNNLVKIVLSLTSLIYEQEIKKESSTFLVTWGIECLQSSPE